MTNRSAALPAILLAAALVAAGAPARAGEDHDAARKAVESGAIRPLSEILAAIEARHPGRVLEAELERDDKAPSRYIYEIKVLTADGRVLKIEADAKTADILRVKDRRR